jgi:hypothetical protein
MIDMTAYTNLPVFRSSYDLMIEVFNLCGSLPKDDRHTVGERLKNTCMDLNLGICEAHASDDKSEALGRCRRYVMEIQLYLRMLFDLGRLSVERYAALSEQVEETKREIF